MKETLDKMLHVTSFYKKKLKDLGDESDMLELQDVSQKDIESLLNAQQGVMMNSMSMIFGVYFNAHNGDLKKTCEHFATFITACCKDITELYDRPEVVSKFNEFKAK